MAKIYFTPEVVVNADYLEILESLDDFTERLNLEPGNMFIKTEVTTDVFQTINKTKIIRFEE